MMARSVTTKRSCTDLSLARHAMRLIAVCSILSGANGVVAYDEPRRAKVIKSPLITAYKECTAPNTVTAGSLAFPACHPAEREDSICGFEGSFSRSGFGKAAGQTTATGDFKLSFTVRQLSGGCEGRTLCAAASVRVTTERCVGGPCSFDLPSWIGASPTGCCIVRSGGCTISTSVNRELLGALEPGEKTAVVLHQCGLKRIDGEAPPAGLTFTCGVLAP